MIGVPYPDPPHLVIGFAVEAEGAVLLSRVRGACSDAGIALEPAGSVGSAPDGGPVLVRELAVDRSTCADAVTTIEIVLSGDALAMPPWIKLDLEELRDAEAARALVEAIFDAVSGLDPLYLGVAMEWRPPTPSELTSPERWIPGDLWWAGRLDAADPALADELEQIFGAKSETHRAGRILRAGNLLRPSGPAPEAPLAAGAGAAHAIARAIKRYCASRRTGFATPS